MTTVYRTGTGLYRQASSGFPPRRWRIYHCWRWTPGCYRGLPQTQPQWTKQGSWGRGCRRRSSVPAVQPRKLDWGQGRMMKSGAVWCRQGQHDVSRGLHDDCRGLHYGGRGRWRRLWLHGGCRGNKRGSRGRMRAAGAAWGWQGLHDGSRGRMMVARVSRKRKLYPS